MNKKRKPHTRGMSRKQAAIIAVRQVMRCAFDCIRTDKKQKELVDNLAGALGGSRQITEELYRKAAAICESSGSTDLVDAVHDPRVAMPARNEQPLQWKRRWKPSEDAILRQHYPDITKCMDLLPGRTGNAAYLRARMLGLTRAQR